MNILFLTSYSPFHELTGPIAAGAEIAMRSIAERLAARGHHVHFLSFDKDIQPQTHTVNGVTVHLFDRQRAKKKVGNFFLRGISYLGWKFYKFTPSRMPTRLLRKARKNLRLLLTRLDKYLWGYKNYVQQVVRDNNIEVIKCFTSTPDSLACAMVANKLKIPLVLRMGGRYWYLKYINTPLGKKRDLYHQELNYVFGVTSCMAYNSRVLKDDTVRHFKNLDLPHPELCPIIDIGVRAPQLSDSTPDFIDQYITSQDIVLAVVGKFKDYSKRQDLIISALKRIGNSRVKVCFAGSGPNLQDMKNLAMSEGVLGQCVFLGSLAHDDIFHLLKRADIFIHPTEFEGSSKAIAEAMLLDRPVIASDIPAIREHITHGENGLLAENTVDAFTACISKLIDDESLRKQLGSVAGDYAITYFDPEQNILRYEELFQAVIDGTPFLENEIDSSDRFYDERLVENG